VTEEEERWTRRGCDAAARVQLTQLRQVEVNRRGKEALVVAEGGAKERTWMEMENRD